jgi:predicted RNA-binding Zn-ribbon protein involved in translation (DUF1610 family)
MRHILIHEERTDKYKCPKCNAISACVSSYKNHMKRHSGIEYICEQCGKVSKSINALRVSNIIDFLIKLNRL